MQRILGVWSFLSVLAKPFDGVQHDVATCICVPALDVETVLPSGNIWKSCLKYEWYLESCIPQLSLYLIQDFQISLVVYVDKIQPKCALGHI